MTHERIQTILTTTSLIAVMGTIGYFMHGIFVPDPIYAKPPAYTQSSYEELWKEKIYYEQGYKDITGILESK